MTADLKTWLQLATRGLSKDSSAQVRTEIQEHFESARESALSSGSAADEADRIAVAALGDAKFANRQYRNVLLTPAEAKMLKTGNWEARAFCSNPGLKWALLAIPVAAFAGSAAFLLWGQFDLAKVLVLGGIAMGFAVLAPFLPVYTTSRARVFRVLRWTFLAAAMGLAFGPELLQWSWLLAPCAWPMVWTEWTRASIRRKLPIAKWPKQLYL